MNEVNDVVIQPPLLPDRVAVLIEAFLSGRNRLTIRAYRQDLEDFATFSGTGTVERSAQRLLASSPGDANAAVLAYRNRMVERGLKAATINRRLAAVRAFV